MNTKGLDNVWGFEQLDRAVQSTLKLVSLCVLVGCLVALTITLLTTDGTRSNPVLLVGNVMLFVIGGVYAAGAFVMCRFTEDDVSKLEPIDAIVAIESEHLRPSKAILLITVVVMVAAFFGLFSMAETLFVPDLRTSELSSPALFIYDFVAKPFAALMTAPILVTVCLQPWTLSRIAGRIDIDLLRLAEYQPISNAAVRVAIFFAVIASLVPPMMFVFDGVVRGAVLFLFVPGVLSMFIIISAYLYPIVILRNRIRQEKERELKLISERLFGREAYSSSRFASQVSPQTKSDLLLNQMFIESRWEWPIAPHLQKLILFGLLPPISWVLAATIENILY